MRAALVLHVTDGPRVIELAREFLPPMPGAAPIEHGGHVIQPTQVNLPVFVSSTGEFLVVSTDLGLMRSLLDRLQDIDAPAAGPHTVIQLRPGAWGEGVRGLVPAGMVDEVDVVDEVDMSGLAEGACKEMQLTVAFRSELGGEGS